MLAACRRDRDRPACGACRHPPPVLRPAAFLAPDDPADVAPGIVLGVSLLSSRDSGLQDGLPALLLGHTLLALPYCTFIIIASLARLDRSIEDAARGLGANEPHGALRASRCPTSYLESSARCLFGFTISIGEFVVSFFLTSAGTTTLPIRIYSIVKVGITPEINAVSTLILAATLALTLPPCSSPDGSPNEATREETMNRRNLFAALLWRAPSLAGAGRAEDKIGGEINILSWGNYIDFALPCFEEKYGVKVNIDYYADEQEAMNKIRAAGLGTTTWSSSAPASKTSPSSKS